VSPPLLSIRDISKRFGAVPVLDGITLDIEEREFLTILGESGSGKTTLLRIIAGFEQPDTGEVRMGTERLDEQPPNKRNVNTVFQHYALFPHLSVFENVAYGLRAKQVGAYEIKTRVDGALGQMKMLEFASRRPTQLSGGQQQRVALARALVNRPAVLLLDEPLSALDASLRRHMQTELKALQREVGITFVFVTHDQDEAMTLSDRIALLRNGRIEQLGTPRDIYNRPRTAYVATFVGQTNLLDAEVKEGCARVGPLVWPATTADGARRFSLRPESIRVLARTEGELLEIAGKVRGHTFTGASELLEVDCEGLLLRVRVPNQGYAFDEVLLGISERDLVPLDL
jgi:ABC-type Fe3+/spermidine/putrescine transport system ATPase subunit